MDFGKSQLLRQMDDLVVITGPRIVFAVVNRWNAREIGASAPFTLRFTWKTWLNRESGGSATPSNGG